MRQRDENGSRAVSDEAESLNVPGVGRSSDRINGETRKHTNTTAIAMGRDQGTTNSGTRKNTPKQQKKRINHNIQFKVLIAIRSVKS